MQRKILSSILIIMILIFQIDYKKKEAQAIVLPAIIVPISYIATAMVAAGAVGYFTKDENGVYGGNLYDAAKATWDTMTTNMQNDLSMALAVGSFVTMSSVGGLWDFLHGQFTEPNSLVPVSNSSVPFSTSLGDVLYPEGIMYDMSFQYNFTGTGSKEILNGSVQYKYQTEIWYGLSNYKLIANFTNGIVTSIYGYDSGTFSGSIPYSNFTHENGILKIIDIGLKLETVAPNRVKLTCGTYKINTNGVSEGCYGRFTTILGSGITGFVSFAGSVPTVLDGDSTRAINPPLDPTALNMATPVTTYLDRNGVITTPIPSPEVQQETNDKTALKNAAAAAAAAAYAAAIAAGLSPSAAMQAAIDAAIAAGVSLADAQIIAQTVADTFADTAVGDMVKPIEEALINPLPLGPFKTSLERLANMPTSKGEAPVITIPLNSLLDAMQPITKITGFFPQNDYVIVDFRHMDTIQFQGVSLIDYFRTIMGFGFIIMTFLYCYRKVYPKQVIS